MLCLAELFDKVLGQLGADFGVTLFGFHDELIEAAMVLSRWRLEVVPAAFHMAVVRVE